MAGTVDEIEREIFRHVGADEAKRFAAVVKDIMPHHFEAALVELNGLVGRLHQARKYTLRPAAVPKSFA